MDIYKLKDLSAAERRLVLESEAAKTEEQTYLRPLGETELLTLKDELAQASIEKEFINNDFKDVKDEFKAKLKPIDAKIKTAIMCLSHRSVNESGTVYLVPDFDNKMMHTVTAEGVVLNSRPLKPEERQFTIGTQKAS